MATKKYLFLNSSKGQGGMFSINPMGITLFLLFLFIGSGIGIWSLATGEITFDNWKFRLKNIENEQEKIKEQLAVVTLKSDEVREDIQLAFENIEPHLMEIDTTKVDSSAFYVIQKLSLEEFVNQSKTEAENLHQLVVAAYEDSSYWYHIPIAFPLELSSPWYFKNEYGMMNDPISGVLKMHEGIDISAERGTPVLATAAGRVKSVKSDTFWGKIITVDHKFGYRTIYAHLSATTVKRGDRVERGDTLGRVGETGWTTSPLVHYEIQKDGESFDPTIILWYLNRS